MSSVKIQGSATGTANFTIAVPDGTSTDRTITLPDAAGSFVLDDGSGNVDITGTVTADRLTADASGEAILSLNGYTASQDTEVQLVAVRDDVSTSKSLLDIKTNDGTSLVRRMRITSDGNVGIGANSPPRPMTAQTTSNGASFLAYRTSETNGDYGGIEFHNHPSDISNYRKGAIYFRSNGGGFGKGELAFCIDNASDSGNVGLGDEKMRLGTGYDNAGTLYLGNYVGAGNWDDPGANNTTGITFRNLKSSYPAIMTCSQGSHYLYRVGTGDMWTFGYKSSISATNVGVGTISTNGSSTSYNTTSDYRLKENVTELTGAIDRVKQVPVHRFNFTATPENTVDGFLAHEVQAVVPEAVTGTKDGMKTEEYEVTPAVLDDDGNVVTEAVMGTREVPEYQGIDQSKLVPLLTQALKDAITKIEALETRVAALEAV